MVHYKTEGFIDAIGVIAMTGPELARLREALPGNVTQQQAADALGVHKKTYQQWEWERRGISPAMEKLISMTFENWPEPAKATPIAVKPRRGKRT